MARLRDRTGETNTNTQGLKMKIIGYRSYKDIDVQFEDGVIVRDKSYGSFIRCSIAHPKHSAIKVINNHQCKWAYQENGIDYYMCQCTDCGKRGVLTIEEIEKHKCKV